MAHITGGGFPENLERLLGGKGAQIKLPVWENVSAQKILHHIEDDEAIRTFNMGFGWVVIVSPEDADASTKAMPRSQVLGEITDGAFRVEIASSK